MVYLVEAFRSRHATPVPDLAQRVRAVATRRSVSLLGRFAIPSDEIDFWLFDAASRDDLTATLDAAEIGTSRISQVEDLLLVSALDGVGA